MNFSYTFLVPLIPFVVFIFLGFFYNRIKEKISGWIGVAGLTSVAVLSYYTAIQYFYHSPKLDGKFQTFVYSVNWMNFTDTLKIDMGVLIDPISVMMMVVVSTISLMVHIYSMGYMHGDRGFTKFYSFLSLFTFSMMGLVLATNLFQIYIFWELVGVSSFLLIGYYYEKPSAVAAAKKAFIVTRFADFGFLIGILLVGYYLGSFDFQYLNGPEGIAAAQKFGSIFMGFSVIGVALVLMFMGGAGKSAMFPLHIWLPDAMEGPTPVSALIHAATMVVAGVYLVARMFPMFHFVDHGGALHVVAWVGAISSLIAAIIALTQFDIKRVLAFSTMSQIGYMMLALGVSGYDGHEGVGHMASMWHLFTHAMFKGLLFLAAGSVIHAVHSNLMQDMGGLHKYMKITSITFLIAALSIAGFPGFSGFFSKDEILIAAFHHNKPIFYITLFIAGLTAFYMFRLYFSIFWNKKTHYHHTPHESSWYMLLPMIFLAFMSIAPGYFPFTEWVAPDKVGFHGHIDPMMASIATTVGVLGIGLAYFFYFKPTDYPAKISVAFGTFYVWTKNKFYIDELYLFVTKNIIFKYISGSFAWFDKKVVDGTMNLIGNSTVVGSEAIKGVQSGKVQDYAFAFVGGVIILVIVVIYML
jgi:NADH-quinone oxidoreductase subunit L